MKRIRKKKKGKRKRRARGASKARLFKSRQE